MERIEDATVRYSVNPNNWLTPMGALCWADHELTRTSILQGRRESLDVELIPFVVADLGLDENLLNDGLGPHTSRRVIDVLDGYTTTSTSLVGDAALDPTVIAEYLELLRIYDSGAGTGTEWLDALDAVAGEEWASAIRAGDGLPAAAQRYADALAASAQDGFSKLLKPEDLTYGRALGEEDYWAFVELAKYDQNCRRAFLTERPPPPLFDLPDAPTSGSESVASTTTTVRSGSVSVSGAELFGYLRVGEADVGVGYSRPGGVGSLSDTTFTHDGVGYEVERWWWWPNGTVRVDTYPDGLETAIGADAVLVVTPTGESSTEYVWDVSDARYLGGGADFVWDTTFTPDPAALYKAELRIGVPDAPTNVTLSGAWISWDAPSAGPTVEKYYFWMVSTRADGTQRSYYNIHHTDVRLEITYLVADFGPEFTIQVRSYNSNGYSPWTELQTFTTPTFP